MSRDEERERLCGEYLAELERERALTDDLATDLESVRRVLSEALTVIERQTKTIAKQSDRIRVLMGLAPIGPEWHPPIRLVDLEDVEIPLRMTLAAEIGWTRGHTSR